MDVQCWLDYDLFWKSSLTHLIIYVFPVILLAIFLHNEAFVLSGGLSQDSPMNDSIR